MVNQQVYYISVSMGINLVKHYLFQILQFLKFIVCHVMSLYLKCEGEKIFFFHLLQYLKEFLSIVNC